MKADRITITDPSVEYRKICGQELVLVVTVTVGAIPEDCLFSAVIEHLSPRFYYTSMTHSFAQIGEYVTDAMERVRLYRESLVKHEQR